MQNLLAGWKSVLEDGVLSLPYSVNSNFSFLDLEDLAEAAQVVFTESGHLNAVYELAGTAPMSHTEVAEIMGRILDRRVKAEKQDISEWRRSAMGSDYTVENLSRMFEYYDRWGLAGNPNVLKWLLRREPTSMESFLRRAAPGIENAETTRG